jgi:uncharacterized linocin/CFP29 family protein
MDLDEGSLKMGGKGMELPPEITWNEAIQKRINDTVAEEVCRIRICQKVFPTRHLTSIPLDIPDDTVIFPSEKQIPEVSQGVPQKLIEILEGIARKLPEIPEGVTKKFVELNFAFEITIAQAGNEQGNMTCQTLSRMAAKSIALAEDMILFRGKDAVLPAGVEVDRPESAKHGLLGAAAVDTICVERTQRPQGPIWGEKVFAAVTRGIAKLVAKGQAPDYALFLPTDVYADTFVPPGDQSLVTTADRIRPLVEGGFYGTGTLPADQGLLVALGGQPTVIYMGEEAEVEYVRRDRTRHIFCVTERVQFVARDPRALIRLKFKQQAGAGGQQAEERAQQAEERAQQAEERAQQAEERAQQAEARA